MPVPSSPARTPDAGRPAAPGGRRRAARGHAPAAPARRPAGTAEACTAAGHADELVRWAVFCCVLVPVVLVVYGTSLGGAAGAALGLVSVTAACRVLLRRSERGPRAGRGPSEGVAEGAGSRRRKRTNPPS
ncbi:hypothetical protein [Streptomyces sp.]|uniref:hypothetical protein n=1 Tax=Streptomyces sp. TaxID=1931 RepID=UPI0028122455|nr:hypothetical protein [Streptomyces sp.]